MFVCISKSEPDWRVLLPNAANALGRSVTASLDARNFPLVGVASFLAAIAEFEHVGSEPLDALRHKGLLRRHAHFTFLVNIERIHFFSMSSFGLAVTPADFGDFAVVSGRISEWVAAVVDGTASNVPSIRRFFCLMLAWFEKENLGECWGSYEKDHQPEGYFRLVRK